MLLTIGIPSFNRPTAASDAIINLLAKDIPKDVSVLLANNGSSAPYDFNKIENPNNISFKYIRFEENLGIALNILRLLEVCEAKYVLLMSDEDNLDTQNLEILTNFLKVRSPSVVLLRNFDKNKTFKKLKTKKIKELSSYMSGIVLNLEMLAKFQKILKKLAKEEDFGFLYIQVLMVALLHAEESGYQTAKPSYQKRVNLPSHVTSRSGNNYGYPTERALQYISILGCIQEFYPLIENKTRVRLSKFEKSVRRKFFGTIVDSIESISPNIKKDFMRSSYKTLLRFEFMNFFRK